MKIISHRGYWKESAEKNSSIAFKRSFDLGYGTETDIRDRNGELVISHDIPIGGEMTFEGFLQIYKQCSCNEPLALNIKSDGLQKPLKNLLDNYGVSNYFIFDMSVPDAIASFREGLKCYSRQSEYEAECSFYDQAIGVWMDEFETDWVEPASVEKHLKKGKRVCIVSPELHGRDPKTKWLKYRELNNLQGSENITLCTDLPELAEEFINNGKN